MFDRLDVVVGTQVVAKEELSTLGTGLHGIAPPHEPDPGPVLLSVGILNGQLDLAAAQLAGDAFDYLLVAPGTRCLGFTHQVQGVVSELGEEGHPSHSDGCGRQVDRVTFGPLGLRRNAGVVGEITLVAPLVAMDVVPYRCLLEAGGL